MTEKERKDAEMLNAILKGMTPEQLAKVNIMTGDNAQVVYQEKED